MVDQLARAHRTRPPVRRRRQPRAALPAADPGRRRQRAAPAPRAPRRPHGDRGGLVADEIDPVPDAWSTTCSSWPAPTSPPTATGRRRRAGPAGLPRPQDCPTDIVTVADGTRRRWPVDRRRRRADPGQPAGQRRTLRRRPGRGPPAVTPGRATGSLEVDDEGPGVAAEDRQSSSTGSSAAGRASARGDGDGTGLGLALVAQHAAAHGGRVHVTDRPGGGARFRVELPLEPSCDE